MSTEVKLPDLQPDYFKRSLPLFRGNYSEYIPQDSPDLPTVSNEARAWLRGTFLFSTNQDSDLKRFVDTLVEYPVLAQGLQEEIRFAVGRSGQENTHAKFIATLQNAVESFDTSPDLPDWCAPSRLYDVRMLKLDRVKHEIDEDAADKCVAIHEDAQEALAIAANPARDRFSDMFAQGKTILQNEREKIVGLRDDFEAKGNAKAISGIDKKLRVLDRVLECDAKDFIRLTKEDYKVLAGLKLEDLDRLLRVGSFARAIRKSIATKYIAKHLPEGEPTYDTLVAVNGFVEHTIHKVDYRQYFTSDAAYETFTRSINLSALQKQIKKIQDSPTTGMASIQFVPSRTLGLYFAGATGDACLDGSEKRLSEEYPNVTALTIFRNPGKSSERIVGSCLMMETKDNDSGKDVVVLRAINPIVNFINSIRVEDFYESLVDYVKGIAGDRKVAVIIDSNGQASTNRPIIASYLEDVIKPSLNNSRPLSLRGNTRFENYAIDDNHPAYEI